MADTYHRSAKRAYHLLGLEGMQHSPSPDDMKISTWG
jgi:hypothetical protein